MTSHPPRFRFSLLTLVLFVAVYGSGIGLWVNCAHSAELERVAISMDKKGFVLRPSGKPFRIWGVNYDRDYKHRLLEDYWDTEWKTVVEDFDEMQELGANVVRIHLQLGRFMKTADRPRKKSLNRLRKLVRLAEQKSLYLDVTGLGCYHKQDIPEWYDALPEADRWNVQARFWQAIAKTCRGSQAVFCYNLMNEPVVGGKPGEGWLGKPLANKYYVQRIAIELKGRSRKQVARAWVEKLADAIRKQDEQTLITVGVIPWADVWPNAEPLFYNPKVCAKLDFASVHFYPKAGKTDASLKALAKYDVGMPLVIEETYPMRCNSKELVSFLERSRNRADGWMSFYWGKTLKEIEGEPATIANGIQAEWYKLYREMAPRMKSP